MKKFLLFISILTVLMCLFVFGADAYNGIEYQNTGIYYSISNDEITIVDANEDILTANIPAEIEGYPVTEINDYAFSYCNNMTYAVVPNSVVRIGESAFTGCSSLESIELPFIGSSAKNYDYSSELYPLGYIFGENRYSGGNATKQYYYRYKAQTFNTFYIPSSLKNVTINKGNIPYGAFFNCSGLTSVTIGDYVTNIDNYAFYNCSGITNISISDSVTNIATGVFGSTAYFKDDSNWINGVLYIDNHLICAKTSVSGHYTIKEGTKHVANRAFYDCDSLTAIDIVDSVIVLGKQSFYDCDNLSDVSIGDNVTSIKEYTFYDCTNLSSLNLGNSINSIDDFAFKNCASLFCIDIPDSVTSIGRSFEYCSSLTSITIGRSIKNIGTSTFYGCNNLKEIVFKGGPPKFDSYSFYGCSCTVKYPYKTDGWKSIINSQYEGNIKWAVYSNGIIQQIELVSLPNRLIYNIGDSIDFNGLKIKATWSDDLIETITPQSIQSEEIIYSDITVNQIGEKCITISYCDKEVSFSVFIHDLMDAIIDKSKYPESSHDYLENSNETIRFSYPNAVSYNVTFSSNTYVEKDADYIYINGTKYTGDSLAGKTIEVNSNSFSISLISDSYDNYYGYSIDRIVAKIPVHVYSDTVTLPTCSVVGYTTHKCSVCGNTYTDAVVEATGHQEKTTTTKATTSKDGKAVTACEVCGEVSGTVTIYKASSIKLSKTSYTYNGKVQKPTVTVKDSKGTTLKNGTDYTVSYASGCKNTGKYAVKITFKGNYTGTKTLYFNILPSKTTKLSVSQTTTSIKATWKAVTGATGYKVTLYNAKGKAVKTVDTTKTTYTFSKLSKGTTYKVRVTAYKTIDGKKVSSSVYTQLTTATKPGTPTLKVTAGAKKASLSWSKQTGASGYVVYMATSKNGTYKKVATVKGGTKVSYTKTGLTKGKTYYFKVRAYVAPDSKTTVYGDYSAVKSVKTK